MNFIVSVGGFIQAIAVLILVYNIVISYDQGSGCRGGPLGRVDAGVGHNIAAAGLQLCH